MKDLFSVRASKVNRTSKVNYIAVYNKSLGMTCKEQVSLD
jgi:hypothetical protein